jgi:hypothetical protein
MNEQILKDIEAVCATKPQPTIRSRLASLWQFVFNNTEYFEREWKEEEKEYKMTMKILEEVVKKYSYAELNEAIGLFSRGDQEFMFLQYAIEFKQNNVFRLNQ